MKYMNNIQKLKLKKSTTFVDNLSIPIHRWFRYSAGFSAQWVSEVISKEKTNGRKNVIDPFLGSGTVTIEAENSGVKSIGVESHPMVYRIAHAKSQWRENPEVFYNFGMEVLEKAKKIKNKKLDYPELIYRCFSESSLKELNSLKNAFIIKNDDSEISELVWLSLISILRKCSNVGTAPWQYILPNKKKKKYSKPI